MRVKSFPFAACGLALLVGVSAPAEETGPSDAFLEFLAELVDQDGEWIDPMELEDLPIGDEESLDDNATKHTDNTQPAEETP